ncbi:hypothetical protein ACROYT_G044187 [Oculina patagonica]
MAQGGNMYPETIFVQTDPAFNVVLRSLTELGNQNRLQVTHFQTASLQNIESNDESDDRRLLFGGIAGEENANVAFVAFGRTASAVVRMCMLEAANVERSFWPSMGEHSGRRNRAKVVRVVLQQRQPDFRLANDENSARRYWSRYDQLYPHFLIEHEVSQVANNPNNVQATMPSMMLIFRDNFTELVEITTTFTATPMGGQEFNSYIHVTCIVREIIEGKDGESTKQLKMLGQPVHIQDKYFEEMTKVKEAKDLEHLPDAFGELKVGSTTE